VTSAAPTPALAAPIPSSQRIGFLLMPRFSFAALGAALSVVDALNEAAGEVRLLAGLFAETPSVAAANGIELRAAPLDSFKGDALIVLADSPLPEQGHDALLARLAALARHGTLLGGFGTGAWLLARAGVLDGFRATVHWPYTAMFAESFPKVIASSNVFELDGARLTSAGGQAALDAMFAFASREVGAELAAELLDQIGIERVRGASEHQRVPLAARIGGGQPKLMEAVKLMEANFEEPLPTEDIARLVGVSRRQLERLFKQHLDSLPSRYYLELRLGRARQLLRETSQSILQIGLSCGFSSGPHFSSAYRTHFGTTPREERSKRLFSLTPPAST
jgi:transcriptional regulator GlxA family with amidase domain